MDSELKEELNASLEAANNASSNVRNQHFTFVLFMVYFSLIIASTTDKQLLLIGPVNLPLVNVEIPLREFYVIAPSILVFLHFHLLVQFYLLAQKLHRFKEKLPKLTNKDQIYDWSNRLSAFSFNHLIISRQHKIAMRYFLAAIVLVTVILLPLVLLLWSQARFIPYQSEAITWTHRAIIFTDAFLLWVMWPRIITLSGKLSKWWQCRQLYRMMQKDKPQLWQIFFRWRRRFHRYKARQSVPISFLCSFTLLLSVFVIVIPNGWMEVRISQLAPNNWLVKDESRIEFPLAEGVTNNRYFLMTYWFFNLPGQPFRQNLFIHNEILVVGADSSEMRNLLRSQEQRDRGLALKKIEGLSLQERNLRYADFTGSILLKANLGPKEQESLHKKRQNEIKGADLRGATLWGTELQGAILEKAQLQGATIFVANLQRANLRNANLQETNLVSAQLQGANLYAAKLQNSNLRYAQLQGTNLNLALLQGAELDGVLLQGAFLRQAQLLGTNLENAQLQGADLKDANLLGANLYKAQFHGANLRMAQLQGAVLKNAQLIGTDLEGANLNGAILNQTEFGSLSKEEIDKLVNSQKAFHSEKWYTNYVLRLKKREGFTATGLKDSNAIYCKGFIENCDLTKAVTIWGKIACQDINIAHSVSSLYTKVYMDVIGKGKKYHRQFVESLKSKECQLTAEEIKEILEKLDYPKFSFML